jgi:L-amino acid N-acyltransferase YncA
MSVIRFATAADAADLAAIYAPAVRDRATSFEIETPDAAEMAYRVAHAVRTPWLVCEHGRQVVGYAYAGSHRERPAYQWSVEVSAYVHEAYHRRGIGRGLYTSLFALLTHQGFCSAYAGVTLPNPASVALHEAVGFTQLGVFHRVGYKQGRWHDVGWFERALTSHLPDPPAPIPLTTILADASYAHRINDALAVGTPMLRI